MAAAPHTMVASRKQRYQRGRTLCAMTAGERVRVVVADDHEMMLEAICNQFAHDARFEVVGTAQDGADLLELHRAVLPDVVLVDQAMPTMTGLEATRAIVADRPDAKVVVLSAFDDGPLITEAVRAGARGYLIKSIKGADLCNAVARVAQGGVAFDAPTVEKLVELTRPPVRNVRDRIALSAREIDVLQLVAEGRSNRDVASDLGISAETVKTYLDRVYTKLGVADRAAAVREGVQRGLIS
jgi:DNA-binding NarL/FixJ family response regulator